MNQTTGLYPPGRGPAGSSSIVPNLSQDFPRSETPWLTPPKKNEAEKMQQQQQQQRHHQQPLTSPQVFRDQFREGLSRKSELGLTAAPGETVGRHSGVSGALLPPSQKKMVQTCPPACPDRLIGWKPCEVPDQWPVHRDVLRLFHPAFAAILCPPSTDHGIEPMRALLLGGMMNITPKPRDPRIDT
uniref:Uncharacterized protein n=1 Tax=Anopheles albimanus TaxID=7167 RepID=A0A182FBI0_ANOAL